MEARLKAALRLAARITRKEARNFYFAFLTLPHGKRLGIYALYAFFRRADDIADGPGTIEEKQAALAALRAGLSSPGDDPVLSALAWAKEKFSIPEELLSAVIDGVGMDLTKARYRTFEELKDYCWHVAAAVGLTVLRVLGAPPEADQPGERFGIGMQLVNILRDVREDLSRGRIYLPQEDLSHFGVSEEALARGEVTEGVRRLLSFEAARAKRYMEAVNELLPLVPKRGRPCIGVLAALYGTILRLIQARGYDVFSKRVSLSTLGKLAVAWRAMWQSRSGAVSW
ncbi:MAG: Phytoene desaturase [Acetothermia bacterium 64_32]|nr:MAG: Phytoene desaturase [Acetothermia bacterium 64_32]HAF71066.1 farnesyl-diphosphate farnesyltransferase [Candidatus Acetothermia bacterium]